MNTPALHTGTTHGLTAARAHTADTSNRRPLVLTDMRNLALHAMGLLLLGLIFHVAPVHATVMAEFDGGADTPLTLEEFGNTGSLSIEASGGNPGGFLRLTEDGVPSQHNYASFDNTDAGAFSTSSFSFDFRITDNTDGSTADGFSFSYADTGTYGTSGGLGSSPFGAPEHPIAADVLGFSFDTWWNGSDDGPTPGTSDDLSEVSVFWDGALVDRIDDTRLLTPVLTLDDGLWHTVTGLVDFDAATVSLSVDGNALFTDLAVPGLTPFESRILYAARTGGAVQESAIDNVLVEFGGTTAVPEPGTLLLLLLGAVGILLTQGRRRHYQAF